MPELPRKRGRPPILSFPTMSPPALPVLPAPAAAPILSPPPLRRHTNDPEQPATDKEAEKVEKLRKYHVAYNKKYRSLRKTAKYHMQDIKAVKDHLSQRDFDECFELLLTNEAFRAAYEKAKKERLGVAEINI